MNMDITSHAGRARSEELVPSRYALQVGEIDVLVVSDGVLRRFRVRHIGVTAWQHCAPTASSRRIVEAIAQ